MSEERPGTGYWDVQRDPLERAQDRLYSPSAETTHVEPALVQQEAPDMSSGWHIPSPTPAPPPPPKKPISWTVIFFGITALFFFVAAGVSFLFLSRGGRSVSSDNIVITLGSPQGLTSIASGTTVPLTVAIQNHNPAAITDATITFDLPEGARSATDVTQGLPQVTNNLGTIPAGGTSTRTVQAVLFGNTNQSLTIKGTLQYHTANSNALFTKEQTYQILITSSPLAITAQAVPSVAPGQPFTIAVSVRSNASTPLTGIAVAAQYPTGFTAVPAASGSAQGGSPDAPVITLGTLAPGQERNFTLQGSFSGSDNEQKNFDFTVGTVKTDGTSGLSVVYASQSIGVTLSKPFISSVLTLNHSSDNPLVLPAGSQVSGLITWANTLATTVTNATVSVMLSGTALDTGNVGTTNGFFDSSKSTIIFTPQTESSLATMNAGSSNSGSFTFNTKSIAALASQRNPYIKVSVGVSGQTTDGQQSIANTFTSMIKIATNLQLTSHITRLNTPFTQTGAYPPVPNTPTTYSVILLLTNSVNSVGGAVVSTILPSYVTYTGQQSTGTGVLSYDNSTRTVTWNVGDVPAGISAKPITAAFQVSFLPSTSQINQSPILIENQTLTGTDRFTNTQVGNVASALTIENRTDPGYDPRTGTVGSGRN
jgi:hypothetical protein